MKFTLMALLTALVAGLSSCFDDFGIEGNGRLQTEERDAVYFDQVSSSGSFQVYVLPGDEPSIEVTAESNLLPYIETQIDGNQLTIKTKRSRNLNNKFPIEIYLFSPQVKQLQLSGSGLIETGHLEAERFEVSVSGSGKIKASVDAGELKAILSGSGQINLNGQCSHSEMRISGSGKIASYHLEQEDCQMTISGSGEALVNVSHTLDVNISGSGNVRYINTPVIHSNISGSGKVINDN